MRKVILASVIVCGLGGAWSCAASKTQSAATVAPPVLADFEVTVESTSTGVRMECLRGCAWTKLDFSCGSRQTCKAAVDNAGMTTPAK
jgi:hypothetical protein